MSNFGINASFSRLNLFSPFGQGLPFPPPMGGGFQMPGMADQFGGGMNPFMMGMMAGQMAAMQQQGMQAFGAGMPPLGDAQLLAALVMFAMNALQHQNGVGQGRDCGCMNGGGGGWGGSRSGSWNPGAGTGGNFGGGNQVGAGPGAVPLGQIQGGTASGRQLAGIAQQIAGSRNTVGWCYKGVADALARVGVNVSGRSAYMAADQLARNPRFQEVRLNSGADLRNLPPGAVVVWGQTASSPHGHISVALGNGKEASDHIQNQITSLRGASNFRVFIPR